MSEDRVEITRRRGREGSVFELSGNIGEHFDASSMLTEKGLVVLDMDRVNRITSFGVREWVNTLGTGESQGLYDTKCRPMIVTQFNMVVGFEAGGTLLSFYLPYVCEHCDHETEVLLDLCVDWQVIEEGKLPDVICPSCGAEPEFDEMPSSYFSYAAMKGRPQVSPALRALLDGSQEETPFVLQKEVVGSVTALWLSGSMEGGARVKRAVDGVEGIVLLDFGGVTKLADKPLTQMASALASSGSDFYFARVPTSGLSALPTPSWTS